MDPTTVQPPSPQPPPHTPTDTIIDASGEPSTSRNIENLKSLVLNLAGRLLPAHQSLIERRFDEILPDELLVPDHPPYADMILIAMWELNREGASSGEAISDFIRKEYHELPWAHTTILNHHLRDLQMKGKITMTPDKCYVRCPLITKPIARPSSRCPSPMSSSYSSSSASLCSTPSSSSTSFCRSPPHQTHERKRKRRRKNMKGRGGMSVQVRGRGRGRGRGRPPLMIQVGQQGSSRGTIRGRKRGSSSGTFRGRKRGRLCKEVNIGEESQTEEEPTDDDVEEPKQGIEDLNEVRGMEVEEDAIRIDEQGQKDGAEKQENQPQTKNNAIVETGILVDDQTEVITGKKVCEEWNGNVQEKGNSVLLRRSRRNKIVVSDEEDQPQKQYKVTWIGRGVRKLKEGRKELLEDDVSEEEDVMMIDSEVDEHVERLEQKEEKGAIVVEHNQPEEKQQSDIVEKQVLWEEHDDTIDEQIRPEEQLKKGNKEENQTREQQNGVGAEKNMLEKQVEMETVVQTEAEAQNDYLTEEQVKTKEESEDLHDDDDVTEELIHPQEQCVEKTKDSLQSCEQDQLKNGETGSTEEQPVQEEQQTKENRKEIVVAVAFIQKLEISEKDTKNNENLASSFSTNSLDDKKQDEQKHPFGQGLRSSCKKQETTPKAKKQLEQVTPVRRSLRSREIISEAAVITEVPDHSKEQIKHPGRASSSRREPKIAEAEQVSTSRKTRSSGL